MSTNQTFKWNSRAGQFLFAFAAIIVFWTYCWYKLDRFFPSVQFFVCIFPLWLLITLGSISLGNIGYHLIRFKDCPRAAIDLQKEVAKAKSELSIKGIKFSQ